MDLGIAGKRAVVCAASKGLGRGCAMALAEAGAHLVINARGAEALEDTAEAIRAAHGVDVTAVAADITTEEGRAKVLDAAGDTDILVNNAGGGPPGMWQDLRAERARLRRNLDWLEHHEWLQATFGISAVQAEDALTQAQDNIQVAANAVIDALLSP